MLEMPLISDYKNTTEKPYLERSKRLFNIRAIDDLDYVHAVSSIWFLHACEIVNEFIHFLTNHVSLITVKMTCVRCKICLISTNDNKIVGSHEFAIKFM